MSCYRRLVTGRGWLGEEYIHGGHRCVAFFNNALYVFRRTTYSVYRAADWTSARVFAAGTRSNPAEGEWETNQWPFRWAPQAACTMGEELWVFGADSAESSPQIRAAALSSLAKAGASATARLLGKPLPTSTQPSDISALASGGAAMVFWHQEAPDRRTNEVWHSVFDGNGWAAPESVRTPYANSDYTVAFHEGAVWLVCKARGERIKPSRPLLAMCRSDGKWSEPAVIPGAEDPRLDWTLDIDAVSFAGGLFVFRACMDRVVAHRWTGDHWEPPETLLELSPWPTYVFWWLFANVAASLVLLPLVGWTALRMRSKPRLSVRAFGAEVLVATWTRRVAAQLVDILVGLLIWTGVLRWLQPSETRVGADGFPGTLALCSSIFFSYFVLSEGIAGQSFGKLLLRIAVVGKDGGRPSVLGVIARNLLRPWPFLFPAAYLVGSLLVLLTRTNRRLGDFLGGTFVVDLPTSSMGRSEQ